MTQIPDIADNDGDTPLHFAARAGNTALATLLREAQAAKQQREGEPATWQGRITAERSSSSRQSGISRRV